MRAGVAGLAGLSAERVWAELRRILAAPDPRAALRLMAAFGVLAAIMPEGFSTARLEHIIEVGAPADPLPRLAALLTGDPVAFADRMRLSNAERERLAGMRAGPVPRPTDDDAALRRMLADTPGPMLIDRGWLADDGTPGWAELRVRLARMERPVFPLLGGDLVALGVPPGPAVGQALARVRAWWLHGGCLADRAACLAMLGRDAGFDPSAD